MNLEIAPESQITDRTSTSGQRQVVCQAAASKHVTRLWSMSMHGTIQGDAAWLNSSVVWEPVHASIAGLTHRVARRATSRSALDRSSGC
jgi:hypothetical protein